MKTWYSSHCCRHCYDVLFLLVTLAVCSWTWQSCDCSSPSGGSLLRLPRREGRSSDRQLEFRVLSGVFQGCLSPSLTPPKRQTDEKKKKRFFLLNPTVDSQSSSHCFGNPYPISHRNRRAVNHHVQSPWLPAAPSSLALTNIESGEAKEVQEQLHKAAEVLKML